MKRSQDEIQLKIYLGKKYPVWPLLALCQSEKDRRKNLVYVDPSQNDYADTLAAPYSVRPFFIPTVSTPLELKEINQRLDPHVFTMDNVLTRTKKKGDLFAGVLDRKIAAANMKILQRL